MLVAGREHIVGVAEIVGHGFFAEDGFDPGFGGGDRGGGPRALPGRDADDIQLLFGQHFVVVGVGGRDRMFFGQALCGFW